MFKKNSHRTEESVWIDWSFSSGRFCDYAIIDFKLHNFQKLPKKKCCVACQCSVSSLKNGLGIPIDATIDHPFEWWCAFVFFSSLLFFYLLSSDKELPERLDHVHAWSSLLILLFTTYQLDNLSISRLINFNQLTWTRMKIFAWFSYERRKRYFYRV